MFPSVVRSHREIQGQFANNKLSETGAAPIENMFLKNVFIPTIRSLFLSDCIVPEDSKMKRIVLFFLTVSFMALVCAAVSNAQTGDGCIREDLTKITDKYFESIQEHKASDLPLASTVKFTENGVNKDIGKGFWETAGKPLLKRTLIDTRKCVTATIAVMEEPFSSKTVGSAPKGGMGGIGGGGAPKILLEASRRCTQSGPWRRTQSCSGWFARRRRRHVWRIGTNARRGNRPADPVRCPA